MRVTFRGVLRQIDWWMLSGALALSGFGLLLIHSLTWPEDSRFLKQVAFLVFGLALFFGAQFLDAHFWRNASVVLWLASVAVLIGLLAFGEPTRGARGWITVGGLGIQPAEFAKLAVVLFLATTLERLRFDIARLADWVAVGIIVGLPLSLVALQPDLGNAFIILVVSGVMVLYTGLDKRKLAALALVVVVAATTGWFLVLADYQKERVLTFLSPRSDPLGAGYNVTQSIVAIGSGGFFGRGLGLGTQSQLNFLPEQETDFIFASTAEELGFLGASLLLLAYLFLLARLYRVLAAGNSLFGSFLTLGVLVMLFSQAAVNVGMNMGLFPVTGVTLPFVSYGGSSLVTSFIGLSIALSARARQP